MNTRIKMCIGRRHKSEHERVNKTRTLCVVRKGEEHVTDRVKERENKDH